VDECIKHFGDWWLVGTKYYADWGYFTWDLANEYVGVAASSGLVPLILFIALIVCGFKYIGRARKARRSFVRGERFTWALGCALLAHVCAFFGTAYFDQLIVVWYVLLAIISATCVPVLKASVSTMETEGSRLSVTTTLQESAEDGRSWDAWISASSGQQKDESAAHGRECTFNYSDEQSQPLTQGKG
jgi:F0F1-type ATP synthase assembly protein I